MKRLALFSALLIVPASAQFGVPGGKRQAGTNFQDMQEMAKAKTDGADGGDMANLEEMMKNALDNPDFMNQMGDMGAQFGDAMEQMMKMSPEELAEQMEAAMKLMTDGDMVENIMNQKDEVIKSLEASGAVPPEELERYKTDPAYFELKMRESFEQMGELMNNPEYINQAAGVMQGMTEMMNDPSQMDGMMDMMSAGMQDDEQIEEARLQFLAGEFSGIPGFSEAFETEEMQQVLKDPVKWRETVKEGFADMMGGGGGGLLNGAKDEL